MKQMKFLAILILSILFSASCVEIQLTKAHAAHSHHHVAAHHAVAVLLRVPLQTVRKHASCRTAARHLVIFSTSSKGHFSLAVRVIGSVASCSKTVKRNHVAKLWSRVYTKAKRATKKQRKALSRKIRHHQKRHRSRVARVRTASRKALLRHVKKAARKAKILSK